METLDNGVYCVLRPKDNEQGIRFIYDIRLEGLSDEDVNTKVSEIKSLNVPVWWPLFPVASQKLRDTVYGKSYQPKPPKGNDEFLMALLPENQPVGKTSDAAVKRVETAADFKVWARMANQIFADGYQDIHPVNHFHWCEKGWLIPYVVYDENTPVAIASILNNNGIASLEFVATLEDYRLRGFARAASAAAIRDAFANGVKIITLRAFYPAAFLYQGLGFQIYY